VLNGVVNSIDGFKKGLTKLGHEIFVFCPDYQKKINEKNVYHCRSFPLPGKSGYHYIYPLDPRKESIARTMDIIHTQHPFIMAKRALLIASKYNKPLIFTNHTQYWQYVHYAPIGKGLVRAGVMNYVKNFANKCQLVIAPAQGIKDKLIEYKVKTPIEIVPNGIDIDKFKNRNKNFLKEKYKFKDWPVFIYVGRIAEEKNLTFLINAFKKVTEKNPECYLVLVGGGPEEKHFKKLIQSWTHPVCPIIITGYLPYNEVPDCLASADVFVSASKTEVHPLTVLEAMASNLPSIVFDTAGTGEIIDDNIDGIKTKADNLNEFADSMTKLINSKNIRTDMGEKALQKSIKYSYFETSKIMAKAYEKAINNHKERIQNEIE